MEINSGLNFSVHPQAGKALETPQSNGLLFN